MEPVNPYSNEIRYTLGVMMHHLNTAKPGSVRIASHSIEMVKSVIRQLWYEPVRCFVENVEIQAEIASTLGVKARVREPGSSRADAALFPFSLEEGLHPTGEKTIIAACYNTLSYKTILYPRSGRGTIFGKLSRLKKEYQVQPVAGLFSPHFIVRQSIARVMKHWDASRHFQWEDRAMNRLIEAGPMWRLSYIVVITGRKTN
jgi:hypothetical protein